MKILFFKSAVKFNKQNQMKRKHLLIYVFVLLFSLLITSYKYELHFIFIFIQSLICMFCHLMFIHTHVSYFKFQLIKNIDFFIHKTKSIQQWLRIYPLINFSFFSNKKKSWAEIDFAHCKMWIWTFYLKKLTFFQWMICYFNTFLHWTIFFRQKAKAL